MKPNIDSHEYYPKALQILDETFDPFAIRQLARIREIDFDKYESAHLVKDTLAKFYAYVQAELLGYKTDPITRVYFVSRALRRMTHISAIRDDIYSFWNRGEFREARELIAPRGNVDAASWAERYNESFLQFVEAAYHSDDSKALVGLIKCLEGIVEFCNIYMFERGILNNPA